jgi:hypothetical protein
MLRCPGSRAAAHGSHEPHRSTAGQRVSPAADGAFAGASGSASHALAATGPGAGSGDGRGGLRVDGHRRSCPQEASGLTPVAAAHKPASAARARRRQAVVHPSAPAAQSPLRLGTAAPSFALAHSAVCKLGGQTHPCGNTSGGGQSCAGRRLGVIVELITLKHTCAV